MNKHTVIRRTVPSLETRYALIKMLETHCHTVGKDATGAKSCVYDPPWTDLLIFEQFAKLNPEAGEITQIIVQHTRRKLFGELPNPGNSGGGRFGGFSDKLALNAREIEFLKGKGLELEARINALEEWATSRKTAPFQPDDEGVTI